MRSWFTGFILLVPFFAGNAVAQALIALPSALASRRSPRAGLTVWLLTLFALLAAVAIYVGGLDYDPSRTHATPWQIGLPLALVVTLPQLVAFPLTRRRPLMRTLVAFAVGVAIAVLWVVAGSLSGATPD